MRASNVNFGPHEDGVLVVDLLVRNMQLKQTVTVLLKDLADTLVDQLVRNLFVLSKHDQVVFLRQFTSLLLVCRRVGNGQVCSAHREQKSLEMVMCLHRSLLTRLLGEEELDWVRRGAAVVATWEQDWNVHSEYVLGGGHKSESVAREETVTLVQVQLVEGVEAVFAARCVEGVL